MTEPQSNTPKADTIAEMFPDQGVLQADGFDDAIIGYVNLAGQSPVICYDEAKVIGIIMEEHGCDYHEAVEFYDFNVASAWMGEGTPCFLTVCDLEEIEFEEV